MPTTTYLIKKNTAAPATLEALGITSADPSYKANGIDSLRLVTVDSYIAASLFSHNDTVALIRRVVDGETTTDTCEFVGTIRAVPRSASEQNQSITYTAENAVKALQRCTYAQDWMVNDGTSAVLVTEPRVVLGENNSGTRLKNGEMIADILAYAASRGINLQVGDCEPGTYTPYDERDNITCWDGIVAMLRYTPDYVLQVDYTTTDGSGNYQPTFNLVAPASMTTVTEQLPESDATETTITPRYDVQVPGLTIHFRYLGDIDGQPVKGRYIQTAGNTTDPEAISLVYDLDGFHIVYVKQEIEVEDWPLDLTDAAAKPFIQARIPWLQQSGVTFTVDDCSSTNTLNLPSVLKSGAIIPWMKVKQERETVTLKVSYTITESGKTWDDGKKELYFNELSTDGTSKEYKKQQSFLEAEPVPPDMAANLYASWNMLHFDGDVTLQYKDLPFHIKPGHRLNLTGGRAEWATMAAIVQDATYNLSAGTVSLSFGTCGRLEADNLMSVYRAARGRRQSQNRLSRDTEETPDNTVEGATGTPIDSVADGTPANYRSRFRVEAQDPDDNQVVIDFNPAAIAYSDVANKAAQDIQLREFYAPYDDAGTMKAKLVQGFVSEPYGTAKELGGSGLPDGVAAYKVLACDSAGDPGWRDYIVIDVS